MYEQPSDIFSNKSKLPNTNAILVLGICSVIFSCFCVGLVLGVIGLLLATKGRALYRAAPELYEEWGTFNAGFILCIIGTSLSVLVILFYVSSAVFFPMY